MASYWAKQDDQEFSLKVKHEMQAAAIAVMNESEGTVHHVERLIYASKILDGSASLKEFCIGVLTNATIKAHVTADTDYTSDLAFVVTSNFNAFAGVGA